MREICRSVPNATVLEGDAVEAVRALKEEGDGGNLLGGGAGRPAVRGRAGDVGAGGYDAVPLRDRGSEVRAKVVKRDIQYVRSGGVAIAHQVVGEGEIDLVYVPDYVSNLVYDWEYALWRNFYERLAQSFRLILFDKRGTGLSDHGGQFASLETRMEDLHAVLDAVGSASPVVFAAHEGCGMATLFAASYPERARALVLFHAEAEGWQWDEETARRELLKLREGWGTQEFADHLLEWGCPSLAANEDDRRWFANSLRVGASPAVAYALNRAFVETDLRDVLPAVRVPTLVLYRRRRDRTLCRR